MTSHRTQEPPLLTQKLQKTRNIFLKMRLLSSTILHFLTKKKGRPLSSSWEKFFEKISGTLVFTKSNIFCWNHPFIRCYCKIKKFLPKSLKGDCENESWFVPSLEGNVKLSQKLIRSVKQEGTWYSTLILTIPLKWKGIVILSLSRSVKQEGTWNSVRSWFVPSVVRDRETQNWFDRSVHFKNVIFIAKK